MDTKKLSEKQLDRARALRLSWEKRVGDLQDDIAKTRQKLADLQEELEQAAQEYRNADEYVKDLESAAND